MKSDKTLLVLDLDGTITISDNLVRFSQYMFKEKRQYRFLLFYPLVLLLKIKIIDNVKFKRFYSLVVLKNFEAGYIQTCAENFVQTKSFQQDLNRDVLKFIRYNSDAETLLLSANFKFLVDAVADKLEIRHSISIIPEIRDKNFSGKLNGDLPFGKNKIVALENFLADRDFSATIALADSSSDLPLLKFVNVGFLIKTQKGKSEFIKIKKK